ncbi:MAG: FAD-dependent oxidoreductase [Acidothermales bacterium]|nr:FAD-dependent oxidoreductase [Acidothermales bacterium]
MTAYELIVVGGGAAGMAAARAGARRGARTLLVQEGEIGGDCTFTGCVPSKTLIEAAAGGVPFDRAMERVRETVAAIAATENTAVLRSEGVEVLHGRARFRSGSELEVDGRRLGAERIVIATGAGPVVPPIPGLDRVPYLTNETAFDLTTPPRSIAVLGGGSIGCELAQAFRRYGSSVTIIEAGPRLLPKEEPDASDVVTEVLRREGVDVRLGSTVVAVDAGTPGREVSLRLDDETSVTTNVVLVAVGRTPDTDRLGLEAGGVEVEEHGFVRTDDHLATTADGVYAAGDVTGRLPFTHAADAMGRLAAANALSRNRWRRFRPDAIPWVTFTAPEVARVGMTEAQAVEYGGRVAHLPMSEVDRAMTAARTDGFVKLIAGPRRITRGLGGGRILGATIVAARAGEMIHEPALAMHTGMFTGRLVEAVHAYPTWSSAVQQAAAQFFVEIGGRRARPARDVG